MSKAPRSISEIIGAIAYQAEDCHSAAAAMERLARINDLVKEAQHAITLQQLEMSFKMVTGKEQP